MLEVALETSVADLELELRLDASPGSCLALVGPSGAGKSTALRAVAGLLRPRAGMVRCSGEAWLDTGAGIDLPPERRRCGYLFQDYALFGHMSAAGNVAYGMRRLPRRLRREAALELLDRFGMAARADAAPATLSGGERQRVALARTIGSEPRALLLDEPLAALDASTRSAATRELAAVISSSRLPTVLVTHDFSEASALAGEVAVLEAGRIVQRGAPDAVAAAPASGFVAELAGRVVLTGRARRRRDGLTEIELCNGGSVLSTDTPAPGPVTVSVHPWEVALEPPGTPAVGSQRNRLDARVRSITRLGNRVRVGLDAGQPLFAEITPGALESMGLLPGSPVLAVWKASTTRAVPR